MQDLITVLSIPTAAARLLHRVGRLWSAGHLCELRPDIQPCVTHCATVPDPTYLAPLADL